MLAFAALSFLPMPCLPLVGGLSVHRLPRAVKIAEVDPLGAELQRLGLNELAIGELLGPAWSSEDVPLVLDRYRGDDPRAALLRLFVLGQSVDAATLPLAVERLAPLVDVADGVVTARVHLSPFAGLLVAHDPGGTNDADIVTGVNAASRTLATLTVRRSGERALDIGTGSGIEALLAARHADSVVATDVNERALDYARLSAELNGLSLDLRRGSLFEPVAGERFDLIVANPPFVVSPDSEFTFRDSGRPGDAICRDVVRGAAAHLAPGGYATVLCNWIYPGTGEAWQPLVAWVEDLPCDALLIAHGVVEPLRYATRWNEPLRGDSGAYEAAVGRWLDYYEREGIAGIGIGAVVLRGRDGAGRVRGMFAMRPATGAAGGHIVRLFDADDGDVLDRVVTLVPGHRLEQALVYNGGYGFAGALMAPDEGVGVVAELDPGAVPLLFELDGTRTVREAAKAAGVEPELAAANVRALVAAGLGF
jgi:methylase of polypeptide subunit release factors